MRRCLFSLNLILLIVLSAYAEAAVFFSDNFNDGIADGWMVANDSGSNPNWQVISGEYTQSNAVGNFSQGHSTGSYSYYNNGFSLANYRITVDITPLSSSNSRDAIGIMFRYQNNDNYYRFVISRKQGFSQLQKKVDEVFTTLGFNGRGFTVNQLHKITIDVQGPKILVYVNNDPLFSAIDSDISTGTVAFFAQNSVKFDNVVLSDPSTTPQLIISQPTSYSVGTGNAIGVSAVAINVPAGAGVEFVLDMGTASETSFSDLTEPYQGTFTSVARGDHTLDAALVNSSGMLLADPGGQDQDHNVQIGVRGEYLVAFGDSITRGEGDNVPEDDSSLDGRNINWGYPPILNNLLSNSLNRPVIVLNEGLGGTTSANGLSRLNATLARHPQSRHWLILFGTNDSNGATPVPSGKGLQPGDPGYAGSYKSNLQQIIMTLKNAGKIPLLAKVPIALGPCSSCTPYANPLTELRNQLIRDYNQAIDELVAANAMPAVPPDLFTHFADNQDEFADNLHPNGNGYISIANLWLAALLPTLPAAQPNSLSSDYNGDGLADLAVFRPSNRRWYVDTDLNGVSNLAVVYGVSTDMPVPADYDGDGLTDLAMFRPATGRWYIDTNRDGVSDLVIPYGVSGDLPLPADYNGDGLADLAVFRPSNRRWYVDTDLNGVSNLAVVYGVSTDMPVPADYDGDGLTDLAMFRPSVGLWYLDTNRDGVSDLVIPYGVSGDLPL